MLFLRHGDAAQDEFGIDLLRKLSEKGRKQAEEVIFPTTHSDVFVSPAVRTLETAQLAANPKAMTVIPSLYAAILLPEMEGMYKEHGEHNRPYLTDPRVGNTMAIAKKAAGELRQLGDSKSLVVGHFFILNAIAYEIYGMDEIFNIDLGTAKGFWINDGKIVQF